MFIEMILQFIKYNPWIAVAYFALCTVLAILSALGSREAISFTTDGYRYTLKKVGLYISMILIMPILLPLLLAILLLGIAICILGIITFVLAVIGSVFTSFICLGQAFDKVKDITDDIGD